MVCELRYLTLICITFVFVNAFAVAFLGEGSPVSRAFSAEISPMLAPLPSTTFLSGPSDGRFCSMSLATLDILSVIEVVASLKSKSMDVSGASTSSIMASLSLSRSGRLFSASVASNEQIWTSPLKMKSTSQFRSPFLNKNSPGLYVLNADLEVFDEVLLFMGSVLKLSIRAFFKSTSLTHGFFITSSVPNLLIGSWFSIPLSKSCTSIGMSSLILRSSPDLSSFTTWYLLVPK